MYKIIKKLQKILKKYIFCQFFDKYLNYNRNMEIYYKKNVLEKLSEILKQKYHMKRIIFFCSSGVKTKYLGDVVDAVNMAKNPFRLSDKLVEDKEEKFNLAIAVGGGRIINDAKIYCNKNKIDLLVIPTSPTSTVFFTPKFYYQKNNIIFSSPCAEPSYVFIDEKIIETCPLFLVKKAFALASSYHEMMFEKEIENLIFNKSAEEIETIKYYLLNLEKTGEKLVSGEREAKLEVMDFMIEIAKYNLDDFLINNLNNMLGSSGLYENSDLRKIIKFSNKNKNLNVGYLIAADLLLCFYKEMFSLKKIEAKIVPDMKKLIKKLQNFNINAKNIEKINNFDEIIENKALFLKINVIKHKASFLAEIYRGKIKNAIRAVVNFKPDLPDVNLCFNAVSIMPYLAKDNFLISTLACVGILDA